MASGQTNGTETAVGLSPGPALPLLTSLTPRQQMAMDCARCSRWLGAKGRVWGDVRWSGRLFRLWVCAPGCSTGRG